jgi:tRNA A-37 threonylcarbamoyl transferase component Bud32/tetratricopeptide (TPR) repeat protein
VADVLERLKAALADRYRIERELGSGGMATVYLADDLKLHRKVAVKVLRPELAASLGADRFLREIKITANLNHPHILPMHDSGEVEGFLFYVMPYVEGESLRDRLRRERQLPIDHALKIAVEVADALGFAHDHNVIHRDIKPENILLEAKHAVVADFGVARAIEEAGATRLTETGITVGTPAYLSPEQASGERELDGRSDIYALGCVLYEMLAGEPPFTGPTIESIVQQHLAATPQPLSVVRSTVPDDVNGTVLKALAKAPADRYQTAEAFAEASSAAQVALATPSAGFAPTGMKPVDRLKRRWMMLGGAVGAAAVIALIAVLAALPRGGLALDPNLVAVAVFRNATGDESLDQVGERAAHWITQGLQQAAIQVTPWDGALQAWEYVQSEADAGRVREPIQTLAEETGAGTVVSGVVYLDNDSLEIQVNVTDARRGRALGIVDPAKGPQRSANEVIADMQQRVMGFLSLNFDERIGPEASTLTRPPSFEAYRAFNDGLDQYLHVGNDEALPYFLRAFELDTTFVTPLIYATLNCNNLGWWAQADSLVSILQGYRDRLSEYDRHWLDYLKARVGGDYPAALRAIRQAAELAPGSKAVYNWALIAERSNRPQEAVDALLSLDPERGPMRGWRDYWDELVSVYLDLGEDGKALEAARQSRKIHGDLPPTLAYEASALAALGRVAEVNGLVNQMFALPELQLSTDLGFWSRWPLRVGVYLRRKGHIDAARTTIDRAIEWFEARLPEIQERRQLRFNYALAFYLADRCDDAYGIAKPLSEAFPDAIDDRGFVGVLAACRGDDDEAQEVSQWLGVLDRPYLHGRNTMWRCWIAAALGDRENAVTLWRQALEEGYRHPMAWMRHWIFVESLRDYPPFQELLRPKG